jgi:hypothetical protein
VFALATTVGSARLRPMWGLKRSRSVTIVWGGRAFVQNLRRAHYELAIDVPPRDRVAAAFSEAHERRLITRPLTDCGAVLTAHSGSTQRTLCDRPPSTAARIWRWPGSAPVSQAEERGRAVAAQVSKTWTARRKPAEVSFEAAIKLAPRWDDDETR